jgi:hypothetical protein
MMKRIEDEAAAYAAAAAAAAAVVAALRQLWLNRLRERHLPT